MIASNISEHDDLAKTRKSLFASCIYTLVIANSTVIGDEISVLGLEILFDQNVAITVRKAVIAFLLLTFSLHLLDEILELRGQSLLKESEEWQERTKKEIELIYEEMERRDHGRVMEFEDLEPWEQNQVTGKRQRDAKIAKAIYRKAIFSNTKSITLKYIFVIVMSFYCIFAPETAISLIQ